MSDGLLPTTSMAYQFTAWLSRKNILWKRKPWNPLPPKKDPQTIRKKAFSTALHILYQTEELKLLGVDGSNEVVSLGLQLEVVRSELDKSGKVKGYKGLVAHKTRAVDSTLGPEGQPIEAVFDPSVLERLQK
eukprot:6357648-Amphidinium_carterae.1